MATAPVPTSELGHVTASGGWIPNARGLTGWPLDESEESAAWQWPTSIATADKMSRHPQVQAVWLALTMPLLRDIWAIDPQGADPARVQLLAEDLDLPILDERGQIPDRRNRPNRRRRGRFAWPEHLRLALLHLRYGSMFFVPVYDADALAETGMARLRKLAPRFPRTLTHIDVAADGGLVGIRQWGAGTGRSEVVIPVERLVAYVHGREGANWAGRSALRPLYRPYELADRAERVEIMTAERNGMGIPTAEVIPGYTGQITQTSIDRAAEVAQAWRAGDYSGAALPPGFRMRIVGVEGSLPDLDKPITRHYGLMAKAFNAMVMELGTTAAGHRALGETFVEMFEAATGGLAEAMARDVMTPHIVEDWWDLNYGPDDQAPAIVVSPGEVPVESVVSLVGAGLIEPDDTLQDWLRERLRLPGRVLDGDRSNTMSARALAEAVQKIYLGVGKVLTSEEAREILNREGAGLTGPAPEQGGADA